MADLRSFSSTPSFYTIGDKYDVPGLKDLTREKFNRANLTHWNGEDS
jgi:hypothetical protein